jgi:CRP-like cAMP-binding protein
VLEKLIKGHGLTMLQVEVLSCHASLVDRQAKLEVGISVEQSTQPVDTSSRASRTRKLLEELHNEKTRLEAQALAAGEVQGTEFKLSAHGQVVSNEGASEGQAVAHENLNTENSGARHGDSTDTGKDIPEKESSPLTSMKVTPVADVRLKSSLVELFLKVAPSMPLFQGQDPRLLQNLSTKFTCLRVEKDQTIVEVDTEGHSMFFLLAGECCVRITGKVVTKLVAPCTFGEVAMLLSERRTAEVRTATDCLMFELAQQDLWNTLNEFPSAANSVYRALKLQAVENVEKNKGAMTTIESHPSALAENLDPLSALNLSDRRQRVLQWHKNYDAEDEGKKGDKLSRTSSWEDTIVPIMNVDPIEAAKKISGVSEHMVSVIKNMDLFRGAPSRAQAQVIAKLVTVTFKAGDVVIQAGTSGTCMYILDVGRVEVKVDNKRVGELGSGAFFGEVALLARKKRTATIVAIEDCKLLQLDQDSVWTVFNMFPNAFQTVKEVATKRLEKAQETMDRESALTSSKIKRKEVTGSRSFRVKFRAPFDRFTPEELGVSIRKSFVAGLTMVKATFHPDWSLPGHPKGSRSSATAHKSKKQAYCFNVWDERYEIFDSMEQSVPKASDPVYVEWIPKERMRKTFYTSGPLDNLVLCIHKVRWGGILGNTKKLELVGKCPLRLQSVLNARGRTREQSCPIFAYSTQTSGVTDQLQIGELKATIHASNDKNELFLLLVPLFDESHVNGHIQEVTDHTGKVIMFLKLRLVPATENTQSVRCTYATLIDIIGLDGSHKGQVSLSTYNPLHLLPPLISLLLALFFSNCRERSVCGLYFKRLIIGFCLYVFRLRQL